MGDIPDPDEALVDFTGDLIKLIVGTGTSSKTLTAHKSQLYKSPFFRTHLESKWQPLNDGVLTFPEDSPLTIRFYLHYLYTNTIPLTLFTNLADLYIWAELHIDTPFQNAVLSRLIFMITYCGQFPGSMIVNRIYDGTNQRPAAKARKFMVEIYYRYARPTWMKFALFPVEFYRDLAIMRCQKNEERDAVYLGGLRPDDYYEEVPVMGGQWGGAAAMGAGAKTEMKHQETNDGGHEGNGEQREAEDENGGERMDEAGE